MGLRGWRAGSWLGTTIPLTLLVLLACQGSPDRLSDCPDIACREAWVLDAWARDPARATTALLSVDDPVEQTALVARVAEENPGQVGALCAALPQGSARGRCFNLDTRPHLQAERRAPVQAQPRTAAGPSSTRLDPSRLAASRLGELVLNSDGCEAERDPHACRVRWAQTAAQRGQAPTAAAWCRTVDDPRWAGECNFRAAEALISRPGQPDLGDAVDLCLLADEFTAQCLGHLPLQLSRRSPPADVEPGTAWSDLAAQAQALAAEVADRGDAELGQSLVDLVWAEALAASLLAAETLGGDLAEHTPASASPHLHAAAALAVLLRHQPEDHSDLSTLSTEVRAVLDRRGPLVVRTDRKPGRFRPVGDLWPEDRDGDGGVPAAYWLGVSRRAVSTDVDTDLRICLLEAAARVDPPRTWLLAEGAQDDRELVRWTAKRLAEGLATLPPRQPAPPPQRGEGRP